MDSEAFFIVADKGANDFSLEGFPAFILKEAERLIKRHRLSIVSFGSNCLKKIRHGNYLCAKGDFSPLQSLWIPAAVNLLMMTTGNFRNFL